MINFTKELSQNTTVVQSEHTKQYSKVPMTAPSRGSLLCPQWIITSSGACLGHVWDNIWGILSTMDNNLRYYMHLWRRFYEGNSLQTSGILPFCFFPDQIVLLPISQVCGATLNCVLSILKCPNYVCSQFTDTSWGPESLPQLFWWPHMLKMKPS